MDLVEFQGKQLFRRHDVPTAPEGVVCRTPGEAREAAERLGADHGPGVVVKAQVKTGGRGKAGGVRVVDGPGEAEQAAESILGLDISGHVVEVVYVEPATDIAEEYYLSIMHDRVNKGYLVICSARGGVDIEQVNREEPEAVVQQQLTPGETADDLDPDTAADILERAAIPAAVRGPATDLLCALFDALRAADATLMEINPLVRTADDRVLALDSKVTLDDNAAFRHDGHDEWRLEGIEAGHELEQRARREGIQYVRLDGTVGVLGNGAGLVMATIDVVAQAGGSAADFLDVGGGASAEEMTAALSLVLDDPRVDSVLINIFGGITRGDEIAEGVLAALDQLGDIDQKLVVRLDGTLADEGRRILEEADHPSVVPAADMEGAAEQAVALAG